MDKYETGDYAAVRCWFFCICVPDPAAGRSVKSGSMDSNYVLVCAGSDPGMYSRGTLGED